MTQPTTPEPGNCPPRECGAADHDQPYACGRPPSTYLAPREMARLMIFRSRLHERHTLRHRGTVHPTQARAQAAPLDT